MSWNFHSILKIDNETIKKDHRKFEYLVVDFLNSNLPLENWKITTATSDNNHDAEHRCIMTGKSSWAEVKYTIHAEKNIESRKYDSSLVSATLDECVIKIFFVTNASIGDQLINRIKKFFYVTKMKEIAFIDKAALENWICLHHEIQQKYFIKWNKVVCTPQISFRTLRVFHRVDSYMIDSILDFESFYTLYDIKNYLIDVEISIWGYDKEPIQLYCNDILLYNGTLAPGIHSFSITKLLEDIFVQNPRNYKLNFYYWNNNNKIMFGSTLLQFSSPQRIFKSQFECFNNILSGIWSNGQIIYNIYGEKSNGKSWILQKIKEDLLRMSSDKKVIYINFCGNDTDLGDLCRIIFTLVFDYYNLAISGSALQSYIAYLDYDRSIYSSKNIKQLIEALLEENYDKIRNILIGAENGGHLFFKIANCYAWEKIYLLDNIHLLDPLCFSVLNTILNRFIPYNNITFIISGREELNIPSCQNIKLSFVQNNELLYYINEITGRRIKSIFEVLPKNHDLVYPYLVNEFLENIKENNKSPLDIYKYYTDTFVNKVNLYKDGLLAINEEDILQILVCSVERGIPIDYVVAKFPIKHISKLLKNCIITKGDYFLPNYNHLSLHNLDSCMIYQNKFIQEHLESLVRFDSAHSFRYIAVLIKYYYECFLKYYKIALNEINNLNSQNKYAEMLFLCNAFLHNEEWHEKNSHILLEIKYFKALASMHCGTVSNALQIFKDIQCQYELYNFEHNSLYYDICAEVIDCEYWQLEQLTKLPYEINIIRQMWLSDSIEGNLSKRPFFTCMNRIMVIYLVNNNFKKAKKWFRKNLRTSAVPGLERRAGYTYMDFAKGTYHIDLNASLSYLEAAVNIFYKCIKTEKRRYLDCQCEIEYVKLLLGKGSVKEFENIRNQLFENEYWTQYYKAALKLSTYYALNGNLRKAKEYLIQAQDTFLLRNDTRCKYFITILESFLFKESPPNFELNIKNTSYNIVLNQCKNNYKMNKAVLYHMGTNEKGCYLDPRVW